MSVALEWVEIARTFANVGFFGVAAFLLWERYDVQHRVEKRDAVRELKMLEREAAFVSVLKENSEAYLAHAVATTQLNDACGRLAEEIKSLSAEVRFNGGGRGGR